MKISTDAPEQHIAILVIAGLFMFLSLLSSLKSNPVDNGINEEQQQQMAAGPKYANPELTWYERAFCLGFQRSSFCSYRFLHPLNEVIKEKGIIMEEAPAKAPGAIDYRGKLPANRAFSRRMVLDKRY